MCVCVYVLNIHIYFIECISHWVVNKLSFILYTLTQLNTWISQKYSFDFYFIFLLFQEKKSHPLIRARTHTHTVYLLAKRIEREWKKQEKCRKNNNNNNRESNWKSARALKLKLVREKSECAMNVSTLCNTHHHLVLISFDSFNAGTFFVAVSFSHLIILENLNRRRRRRKRKWWCRCCCWSKCYVPKMMMMMMVVLFTLRCPFHFKRLDRYLFTSISSTRN